MTRKRNWLPGTADDSVPPSLWFDLMEALGRGEKLTPEQERYYARLVAEEKLRDKRQGNRGARKNSGRAGSTKQHMGQATWGEQTRRINEHASRKADAWERTLERTKGAPLNDD